MKTALVATTPVAAESATVETSIVIRTFNEARNLERLLRGIQEQTYTDWEILLVDSGSTDATLEIARRYTSNVFHIPREKFTFGRSLNLGCLQARGRYLVFVSAHIYPVNNTWLANLVRPFTEPAVGMVYGRQMGVEGSRVSEARDLERVFGTASQVLIDQPCGHNGNAAIRRNLWVQQPFDETLTGLEDLDWVRKIQRDGHRVYYAANAAVHHVHRESIHQLYKRFFREAIAYRTVFPGYRYDWSRMINGLVYSLAADSLYAIRQRVSLHQFLQIPSSRIAEYLARWRGLHYHARLSPELLLHLYYPKLTTQVVIEAAGKHRLKETEIPQPVAGEVLIKVAYVGVCATDLEVAQGQLDYYRRGMARYPIVPGHEFSGVIVEIGAGVRRLRKGDKVVGECVIGCGTCAWCAKGEAHRCASRQEVGVINRDGAYSGYLIMPARAVHRLPRRIVLREAALVEPLAVCLKGLRKLNPRPEGSACVVGAGPLGNLCAQLLKQRKLRVTVIDQHEGRLRLLDQYGINSRRELERVETFDYLIEATGNETVIPWLLEGSKPSVKILLLGLPYAQPVPVTFNSVPCYDKEIFGSIASERQDWEEAIRLIRRHTINLDDHTACVLPIESYETAWRQVETHERFKVLLAAHPSLNGF